MVGAKSFGFNDNPPRLELFTERSQSTTGTDPIAGSTVSAPRGEQRRDGQYDLVFHWRSPVGFVFPSHKSACAACSGSNRRMSPGWHESASQIASSVEKRIARALPVLRIERLASVIPTRSASSVK